MKRTLSITLLCVLPAFALFHFQYSIYAEAQTSGALRIHPTNPLFFMNGSGKAVYLSCHQIFVDLQDNTFDKQYTYNRQSTLDWSWYLQFVKDRHLNYIRNWTLLSTGIGSPSKPIAHPMPYKRVSGHGNANDGGLK